RLFQHPLGAPWPLHLLGIGLLHAVLVTLLAFSQALYQAGAGLRAQARSLGKSVLWATTLLCLTYRMQGAPLRLVILIGAAGVMHFGALLLWRWQDFRWMCRTTARVRNVLIVGAGDVGRRMAAYLGSHPEQGRIVCGFLDDDCSIGNGVLGKV